MSTVEELIQGGVVPGAVSVVPSQVDPVVPVQVEDAPITDEQKQELEAEVIFDYDHIPTGRMKAKRNASPDYAAAMERVSANDYPGCPLVAVADHGGNYMFSPNSKFSAIVEEPVVTEEIPIAPAPVVEAPPAVVIPVPDEEDEEGFVKTASGYQIVIDPGDGSNPEVFKGKTKREVNRKIREAKAFATREIRRRNREAEVMNTTIDATTLTRSESIKPLTAEEIYTLTEQMKDPATAVKAHKRFTEAQLGMSVEEFRAQQEYARQSNVAKRWLNVTPNFYNDPEGINIGLIVRYFESHNIEVNEKNLDTVFNVLQSKKALLDPPIEEPEPEPEVTDPAVVAAPVVPSVPAPTRVAPSTTVQRVRPGSISTGISPRQASVRPGAITSTPVGLTVEEYQRTSSADIKRRYKTDLAFKSGVDKLIAEGKI